MKKTKSSYELANQKRPSMAEDLKFKNPLKYQSSSDLQDPPSVMKAMSSVKGNNTKIDGGGKHKVVIYFSDAYNNICNKVNGEDDNGIYRSQSVANKSPIAHQNSSKEFMAQLKTVLEEKSKFTNKFSDRNSGAAASVTTAANKFKPLVPEKPCTSYHSSMLQINQTSSNSQEELEINGKSSQKLLPSFIESIDENNVIKLKIEQNFRRASELVNLISSLPKKNNIKKLKKNERDCGHDTSSIHELNFSHEGQMVNIISKLLLNV